MIEELINTPIGMVPSNWEVKRFIKETELLTCGVASTPIYVDAENGVPFLSAQNVRDGKVVLDKFKYISKLHHQELTKNNKPKIGDILYSRVGAKFGEAAVVEHDFEFSVYVSLTHIRVKSTSDPYFIKFLLNSNYVKKLARSSVFQGAGVPNLNVKVVRDFLLAFPPLPEQQKIAEILSTVDAKIEVIDQQITETQVLKKGLMQRLLTKGIGHKEFKDSALGAIPKSWEVVKFSELISKGVISKIQDGNHGEIHPVSSDFVDEGIPFIMANCISISNKLEVKKAKRISFNHYKSLRIGFSEPNDVLLTHKGTVGLTAIVEERHGSLMLTPQVTYYRIGDNSILNNKYLYYYFQSSIFQQLIEKFSKQSTRAYIGITAQKNLPITLPKDIMEQNRIAEILCSVDDKLEVLTEKKTHYQELKQGLMQQLLTGKIRVKNLITQI